MTTHEQDRQGCRALTAALIFFIYYRHKLMQMTRLNLSLYNFTWRLPTITSCFLRYVDYFEKNARKSTGCTNMHHLLRKGTRLFLGDNGRKHVPSHYSHLMPQCCTIGV